MGGMTTQQAKKKKEKQKKNKTTKKIMDLFFSVVLLSLRLFPVRPPPVPLFPPLAPFALPIFFFPSLLLVGPHWGKALGGMGPCCHRGLVGSAARGGKSAGGGAQICARSLT